MDYDAHLQRYLGRYLADYGGQCVSNAAHYCLDNGKPIAYANACDWWQHPSLTGAFDFITNDPSDYSQIPPRGAVMIWNSGLPGSYGAGHIAIFDHVVSAGVFTSCDANWGGATVHMVTHNWGYIIGWMVLKQSAPAPSGDNTVMNQGDVINMYHALLGREPDAGGLANYTGKDWKSAIYDITGSAEYQERVAKVGQADAEATQIQNLTNLNNQLNQTITDITSNATSTKAEKDAALAQIADLQSQLTTAMDKLKEAQNVPQVPTTIPTGKSLWDVIKDFFSGFKKG